MSELVPHKERLSIIALIFAVLIPPLGFLLSIIAFFKYRRKDDKEANHIAKVALIISIITSLLLSILAKYLFGIILWLWIKLVLPTIPVTHIM